MNLTPKDIEQLKAAQRDMGHAIEATNDHDRDVWIRSAEGHLRDIRNRMQVRAHIGASAN